MKWMLFALAMMGCGEPSEAAAPTSAAEKPPEGLAAAVFAGGGFWCMEAPFEKRSGVVSVV